MAQPSLANLQLFRMPNNPVHGLILFVLAYKLAYIYVFYSIPHHSTNITNSREPKNAIRNSGQNSVILHFTVGPYACVYVNTIPVYTQKFCVMYNLHASL